MQQDLVVAKKLGDTAGRLKNANRVKSESHLGQIYFHRMDLKYSLR